MTWDNITVRQFQELDIINRCDLDEFDKQLKRVSLIFSVEAEHLPLEKLREFNNKILSLPEFPKDVLDTRVGAFTATLAIQKITGGNFIDLTEYTKDPAEIVQNLHKIAAVFLKPRRKWYRLRATPMDREAIEAAALDLPVSKIYPLSLFFCKVLVNLSLNMAASLRKKRWREKVRSKKAGGGS